MIPLLLTIFSLNQLANTYEEAGVPVEAEKLYKEALAQGPKDYEGHILLYNLGTLYLHQGKWDESLLYYLPLYPLENPPFLQKAFARNFALALIGKGEPFYTLAKEIDPTVTLPAKKEPIEATLPFQKVLQEAISLQQQALITTLRGGNGSQLQKETVEKGKTLPITIVASQKLSMEKGCLSPNWQQVVARSEEGLLYAQRGTARDQIRSLAIWESIFALSLDPISKEEMEQQQKEQEAKQKLFNMTLSDPRPVPGKAKVEVENPW